MRMIVGVASLAVAFVTLSGTIAWWSASLKKTKLVLVHSADDARISYHSEQGLPLG
jgi:uncharacterized iron-regulated membrane protein